MGIFSSRHGQLNPLRKSRQTKAQVHQRQNFEEGVQAWNSRLVISQLDRLFSDDPPIVRRIRSHRQMCWLGINQKGVVIAAKTFLVNFSTITVPVPSYRLQCRRRHDEHETTRRTRNHVPDTPTTCTQNLHCLFDWLVDHTKQKKKPIEEKKPSKTMKQSR